MRRKKSVVAVVALAAVAAAAAFGGLAHRSSSAPPSDVTTYKDTGGTAYFSKSTKGANGCTLTRDVSFNASTSQQTVYVFRSTTRECPGKNVVRVLNSEYGSTRKFGMTKSADGKHLAVNGTVALHSDAYDGIAGSKHPGVTRHLSFDVAWDALNSRDRTFNNASYTDPCTGAETYYGDKAVMRYAKAGGKLIDTDANAPFVSFKTLVRKSTGLYRSSGWSETFPADGSFTPGEDCWNGDEPLPLT